MKLGVGKRVLPVVMVTIVALLGAGCGDSSDSPSGQPAADSAGGIPGPEKTKVTVGVSDLSASQAPSIIAKDLGIYEKYGLEVDVRTFEGAQKVTQALAAGQIDAGSVSGSSAVSSIPTDRPMVTVAVMKATIDNSLVVGKNITSAADLKGKSIAISTFGSTSDIAAIAAIEALGLSVDDVTRVQVGGTAARIAAITSGAAAGAAFVQADLPGAMIEGNHVLVDLTEQKGDHQLRAVANGLTVLSSFADKNPNTTRALVAANIEAMTAMFTRTNEAVDAYAKFANMDSAKAKEAVEAALPTIGPRDGRPAEDMFTTLKISLGGVDPALKNVDLSKAYTTKFVDELETEGILDKISTGG